MVIDHLPPFRGTRYFSISRGPQEFEPTPAIAKSAQSTEYPHFSSSKRCRFDASSSCVYSLRLNESPSAEVMTISFLPPLTFSRFVPQCEPFSCGRR